jgi:acyl-CoA dehydrogenase
MYAFEPSEEQKMLIEVINRYAANDLRPAAREAEEGEGFSSRLINKGWQIGILQASLPEEFGGFGERSTVTSVLAMEELAWGDASGALQVMAPGLFAVPLMLVGSEEQKLAYLPTIAAGDWTAYTAAFLEPYWDFDPMDMRLEAKKEGDKYILSGEKCYVPLADQASNMIVYAKLDGQTQGFILKGDEVGLEIKERDKLLGFNAFPLYSVSLRNVSVPTQNRLGGENGHEFSPILNSARLAMAAVGLGISRAAFEYSRDYAKEREAFGVKIAQKQAIAFMLAEMATEIEAIRLLTWEAAWMADHQKEEAEKTAYLALSGAIDMAMMITDRAVQILGGHGYIREYPVEMWMRNGRGIASLTGLAMI